VLQRILVLGSLGLLHSTAGAEDHGVAFKVGLLGLGVEYTYTLSERLGVRGALSGSQYGFDASESGIEYDFDLIWESLSVAVDYHPRMGPLRLTFGVLSNDNGLEATSRLSGSIDVGGTTYTPGEVGTLRAGVGFDSTAPFAGIGWDWSRSKSRFGMSFDIGVLSQGSPVISLTADGGLVSDPAFQSDLEAERLQLQSELDDFDLMPFATAGFVFRF
jgi:hypothetical protein